MKLKELFSRGETSVTAPTFADMMGISVKTVYHWIYLGKVKAFKSEGHWRVVIKQEGITPDSKNPLVKYHPNGIFKTLCKGFITLLKKMPEI